MSITCYQPVHLVHEYVYTYTCTCLVCNVNFHVHVLSNLSTLKFSVGVCSMHVRGVATRVQGIKTSLLLTAVDTWSSARSMRYPQSISHGRTCACMMVNFEL